MSTATLPGYLAGTWTIDAVHSEVGFSVRHMMVSKVRGKFTSYEGSIVTGSDPATSSASASIDLSSIDTGNEQRDGHLRSADFFNTDTHKEMSFASTAIRQSGDDWVVEGNLTIADVTKPIELTVELNGFGPDAYGGTRAGFTATGSLSRKDFGISFNMPLENGGVVIGDTVNLHLEIEAVLAPTA